MYRVLLTGFNAFGEFKENPTQTIIQEFETFNRDVILYKSVLEVDFKATSQQYHEVLNSVMPHFIINLGLSAESPVIQVEKTALNLGFDRYNEALHFSLHPNGPIAYFSNLPVENIVRHLLSKNIPVMQSNHAGSYLCNMVYYQSLSWCEEQQYCKALFVHIPLTTKLAAQYCREKHKGFPSLPKTLVVKMLNQVINYCLPDLSTKE
ncbi:MAG: hypothetical protein IPM47_00415 [Sphingobacteriales bacterium]|nr:MAG: hypothetical protein IPM47_00415 [Sphingobacteriales bacterium]